MPIVTATATVLIYFSQSPLLMLVGVGAAGLYAVALLFTTADVLRSGTYKRFPALVVTVGVVGVPTSVHVLVAGSSDLIAGSIFLIGSAIVVLALSRSQLQTTVEILTVLMLVVVIGAWLGIVAYYAGLEPIAVFSNPREGYSVWYTTLVPNWVFPPQPSGIYFEPGELSFFICGIAACRHLLNLNRKLTWALLLGGLVTVSLAHVIYTMVHLLSERINWRIAVGACLLIVVVLSLASVGVPQATRVVERLDVSNRDRTRVQVIPGDNRTYRMLNAAEVLASRNAYLWGVDIGQRNDSWDFEDSVGGGEIDANPLYPLVKWGLIGAVLYPVSLAILLMFGLSRRYYLVVFGIGLLLLQRPMLYAAGYSTAVLLVLYCSWIAAKRRLVLVKR